MNLFLETVLIGIKLQIVSLTNKYLLEWGKDADDYVRNETALNYNFDNGLVLFNSKYIY